MTKPNLIQSLLWRTKKREQAKKDYDEMLTLSNDTKKAPMLQLATQVTEHGTVRLLDEGMVVDSEGYPHFYIKKGAIEGYYEQLDADYVGSINIGHQNFATFPFLVGEWTKKDLSIVDIGEGRKGLEVQLNLYEESVFIQELKKRDYPIGVSAEFLYTLDEEASDEYDIQMIETLNIKDFAIVGDAGNVSSSNIQLNAKENDSMTKKDGQTMMEKFMAKFLADEKQNAETVEEATLETPAAEVIEEETAEEETTETVEAPEEETAEDTDEVQEKALAIMETMAEKIAALEEENEALKAQNAQLNTATSKGLSRFEEIVKSMNLDVQVNDKKDDKDQPNITDGFGKE